VLTSSLFGLTQRTKCGVVSLSMWTRASRELTNSEASVDVRRPPPRPAPCWAPTRARAPSHRARAPSRAPSAPPRAESWGASAAAAAPCRAPPGVKSSRSNGIRLELTSCTSSPDEGGNQRVIRGSSEGHQRAIRGSSEGHPRVYQRVIRGPSEGLSEGHQRPSEGQSEGHQSSPGS
jgi:hypothetical protein